MIKNIIEWEKLSSVTKDYGIQPHCHFTYIVEDQLFSQNNRLYQTVLILFKRVQ
jgi:hypothetical protein